jgi:alkylhydroperoxidase/carboxymuconolactone decarboxylase family protein YurZ
MDQQFKDGLQMRKQVMGEDFVEVLLHAAVYCGAPLAVEAFRAAQEAMGDAAAAK